MVLGDVVLGSIWLGGGSAPVTCGVPPSFSCFPSIFAGEHGMWLRNVSCACWSLSFRLQVVGAGFVLPGGQVVAFRWTGCHFQVDGLSLSGGWVVAFRVESVIDIW